MIITNEIIDKGKSIHGGWGNDQFRALGINDFAIKGWKKELIGKDVPSEWVEMFLELKDKHLQKAKKKTKNGSGYIEVEKKIAWKDQYKHPNWQRARLIVLNRDQFTCQLCRDSHSILHVHHLKYLKDGYIWDVPKRFLVSLCDTCHTETHNNKAKYITVKHVRAIAKNRLFKKAKPLQE